MSETILIATNSRDSSSRAVAQAVDSRGYDLLLYEADLVADGSTELAIGINGGGEGLTIRYDGKPLRPETLGAAWYRRPNYFTSELRDKGYQLSVASEYRAVQQGLWDTVPSDAWLSTPEALRRAETKLTQLRIAAQVGFSFPDTVASNRWDPIEENLSEEVVFKPAYGSLYEQDTLKMMYVRALKNTRETLPTDRNPYPGLWQSRKEKYREWRITAIGDDFFDAAIYTDDSAKDDWRRLQATDAVQFKADQFPASEKEKCLAYLGLLGLRYGAFDFIEGSDGSITFLECNPNGQYGWLESQLGLPISDAIAGQLVTIAKTRGY